MSVPAIQPQQLPPRAPRAGDRSTPVRRFKIGRILRRVETVRKCHETRVLSVKRRRSKRPSVSYYHRNPTVTVSVALTKR